jgi:hypothetical protein
MSSDSAVEAIEAVEAAEVSEAAEAVEAVEAVEEVVETVEVDKTFDSIPFKGASPLEIFEHMLGRLLRMFTKNQKNHTRQFADLISHVDDLVSLTRSVRAKSSAGVKLTHFERFVMFFFGLDGTSEKAPVKSWLFKANTSFFKANRRYVTTLSDLNLHQIWMMLGTFLRFAEKELPGNDFQNGKMKFAKDNRRGGHSRGRSPSRKVPTNYVDAFDYCVGAPPERVYEDFEAKMIDLLSTLRGIKSIVLDISPESIDLSLAKKSDTQSKKPRQQKAPKNIVYDDASEFPALGASATRPDPVPVEKDDTDADEDKDKVEAEITDEIMHQMPHQMPPQMPPQMMPPMPHQMMPHMVPPPPIGWMVGPDGIVWGTYDGANWFPAGYMPSPFHGVHQMPPHHVQHHVPVQNDGDHAADGTDDGKNSE